MSARQQFLFEPFLLDLQGERLWRGTETIRLSAKAFGVLRCLVTAAQQLVTKDTLLQTVWPETSVGEAVIAVAIGELRQVLGDAVQTPRFIETVRGRGYRFIAPVTMVEARGEMPHVTAQAAAAPLPMAAASALFVGREAELAQLNQWFLTALWGQRQVGFVAGDPGIGKTALVNAFITHIHPTAMVWIGHGQCIDHYGIGEAYLPLLEALGRLCRGAHGAAFVTLLRQHAPSWLAQMPALLSLAEWEQRRRITSGVTQARMLRELAEALEVFTVTHPLVLVLEDLHWSDPSTLAFLTYVARRRDPARVLIVGTYRPADMILQGHPLSGVLTELRQHQQCVEITLNDLPPDAIAAYLSQRFGVRSAPEALVQLLHRRCSGNPLFLVAMVDELVRLDILQLTAHTLHIVGGLPAVGSIVPESVQQLIAQHVGQLSSAEQALLEAASVTGMTFAVAAIAAVVSLSASDIKAHLISWTRQGRFVEVHGTETWPDGTVSTCYGFRHALYHEVVLRRISPGQRLHLHQVIGSRKEMAYGDQTPLIAAALAIHFEEARDFRRAVIYRQHAAENALQRSAYEEAIAHLTQGLALLSSLPDTPERAQYELTLHLALGTPLSVTKGYAAPEVEYSYTRARELHQHLGDTLQQSPEIQRLFRFYLVRGVQFYLVRGDLKTAQEVSETCLHLAGDDTAFRLAAHYALTLSLFYCGDFVSARWHAEQCMALYDPQHHHALTSLYGYDLGVASRGYAAQALWILGYPDQAQQRVQEALTLARALAHPFSEAFILGHLAVLYQFERDGRTVYERAQALIAFCTEKGFHQWLEMGVILQGWGLAMQGQGDAGITQMLEGLASSGAAGIGLGRAPVMAQLAEAYWIAGRTDEGLQALEQAWTAMETTGERWWAAEIYRLQGELLMQAAAASRLATVNPEAYLQKAIAVARQQQAQSWELRAALSLARLWQQQGQHDQAQALLAPLAVARTEGLIPPICGPLTPCWRRSRAGDCNWRLHK